jgi:hypothetical protein
VNVFLWIAAIVLAVASLGAGAMKALRTKEQLLASGMGWAEAWHPAVIRLIGVLEILAALGLVLPPLLHIAPVLTPLAATGLAIIMVGAVVLHVRRKELPGAVPSVVLLVLAVVVAWGRFGPYAF